MGACSQNCDMNEEMRQDCIELVITAIEKYQTNYEVRHATPRNATQRNADIAVPTEALARACEQGMCSGHGVQAGVRVLRRAPPALASVGRRVRETGGVGSPAVVSPKSSRSASTGRDRPTSICRPNPCSPSPRVLARHRCAMSRVRARSLPAGWSKRRWTRSTASTGATRRLQLHRRARSPHPSLRLHALRTHRTRVAPSCVWRCDARACGIEPPRLHAARARAAGTRGRFVEGGKTRARVLSRTQPRSSHRSDLVTTLAHRVAPRADPRLAARVARRARRCVLIGGGFGFEVTHEVKHMIWLYFGGQLSVLVWKAGARQTGAK
jgi:hypothetical protein